MEKPSMARAEILIIIISIGINTGKPSIAIMDVWLPLREVIADIIVSVMASPVIPVTIDRKYEVKFQSGVPFSVEKTTREMQARTNIRIIPYKSFDR